MAVKFIIDSASDVLPAEARKLGVTVLPMRIVFGSEEYADGVTLNHRQFYEKLAQSDTMPTTCQSPPAEFADAFAEATADGSSVIVLPISSGLSGTYQSALIAAADFENVHVIDTLTVCIGQRILTQYGVRLAAEGLSAEEIVAALEEQKHKVRVFGVLDTLEYLKKGGRISAATALAGSLLSIKPAVSVDDGLVQMAGKARGNKQGNHLLCQLIDKAGGIDFSKPYCLAYTGLSDQLLQKYIADSAERWPESADRLPICTIGCTIGTHVGPGAIAVSFFSK